MVRIFVQPGRVLLVLIRISLYSSGFMDNIFHLLADSSTEEVVVYVSSDFTEEEKIALTLAVVFAALIIVGLGTFVYWYFRISKRRFVKSF